MDIQAIVANGGQASRQIITKYVENAEEELKLPALWRNQLGNALEEAVKSGKLG